MDVLHHKRFGRSAVYDKAFLRWDESGGFWEKMDEILMKAAVLGQKMDESWIFLPS